MIRRIVLENYMAHVRTVIEPADGLTVLVGPNNCGKSAIIHALEMICYNHDAADFAIRHGTKKATVTVETEDEDGTKHTLVWWRKKDTAGYVIDGREISGLGRGNVPDDLHKYLRMPKIEPSAGGDAFLLHFGLQKSPIFLLDDKASRAAHFFATSSDADKLVEMQRRHTLKSANAKRDKDKLDKEVVRLDKQLQVLSPLAQLSERLTALEETHAELISMNDAIADGAKFAATVTAAVEKETAIGMQLKALTALRGPPTVQTVEPLAGLVQSIADKIFLAELNEARGLALAPLAREPFLEITTGLSLFCTRIARAVKWHDEMRARSLTLKPLEEAPTPHDVARLQHLTSDIDQAEDHQRRWQANGKVLQALLDVPALDDVAALTVTLRQIQKLTSQLQEHQARRTLLTRVAALPSLTDTSQLHGRVTAISNAREKALFLQARQRVATALQAPPVPAELEPIQRLIHDLEKAGESVAMRDAEFNRSKVKFAALHAEVQRWVQDNPLCATCGQTINAELIFSGNGGHGHE